MHLFLSISGFWLTFEQNLKNLLDLLQECRVGSWWDNEIKVVGVFNGWLQATYSLNNCGAQFISGSGLVNNVAAHI